MKLFQKPMLLLCFLSVALCSAAQDAAFPKAPNAPEAPRDSKQITIMLNGKKTDRLLIEVNGDKVKINGKDADKTEGVSVMVHDFGKAWNIQMKAMKAQEKAMQKAFDAQKIQADVMARMPDFDADFNFEMDGDGTVNIFPRDSSRAMLGITTNDEDGKVVITNVSKESAAAKAGLKEGDVVKKIGDVSIGNAPDVSVAVRSYKPGDKVSITYERDGKTQTASATLQASKRLSLARSYNADRNLYGTFSYNARPRLGLSVQDTDESNGVKVLHVDEASNAAKAGIQKDDLITEINSKKIKQTDDVLEVMEGAEPGNVFRIVYLRNGAAHNAEIRLPRPLKTTTL